MKDWLKIDDLPNFCYSVHKNVVLRDFQDKTVVYKPNDAYLYTIDFLDIFFHENYRKLNKFISFQNWEDASEILDEQMESGKDFQYLITENYIIFKFAEKIHVVFIEENYALCCANRESIESLELLDGICQLYKRIFFPEVKMKKTSDSVMISVLIPDDITKNVSAEIKDEVEVEKPDGYFWEEFPEDLSRMSELCHEIKLQVNDRGELNINIFLKPQIEKPSLQKRRGLLFKDLREVFSFIFKLYMDYYIIWSTTKPEKKYII